MPKTFVTRLKLIDELIQKRNTGNAAALAARLKVSERTAKEFIAAMKSLGALCIIVAKQVRIAMRKMVVLPCNLTGIKLI